MIRTLVSTDAPLMAEIHSSSFYKSWPAEDMLSHIQKDLVLGHGEPLGGFLIIRMAIDQAELLTLAIEKTQRRKGCATKLLRAAENYIHQRGVDILFLEVAEDNPAAIAFYKTNNYEQFARRPNYYRRAQGRIAALLFRKQL